MKKSTLTLGKFKNITPPGDDAVVYRFSFSATASDMIGSPK